MKRLSAIQCVYRVVPIDLSPVQDRYVTALFEDGLDF